MADRQVLQVVLSGDQREIIDIVLNITGKKVSSLIRHLLLEWACSVVDLPGAVRGGRCGGGYDGCAGTPATWYSAPGRIFVCEPCARKTIKICTPATDENHPAVNIEKLRAAIDEVLKRQVEQEEYKSDDQLLSELLVTAATLAERRKKPETPKETSPTFADLFARF